MKEITFKFYIKGEEQFGEFFLDGIRIELE